MSRRVNTYRNGWLIPATILFPIEHSRANNEFERASNANR